MKSILLIAVIAGKALAVDLTYEWDANTETNLAGYRLHWGPASRKYTNAITTTATTATVSNVVPGAIYYAAATAFVRHGTNETQSEYSAELAFVVPPTAPKGLRVKLNLQSATALNGPWEEAAQLVSFELPWEQQRFYRAVVQIQ
jgi:hypothetical protein